MRNALSTFLVLSMIGGAPIATAADDFVVIKAGRVITVSGEEFAPGTVVIEDGKISAVGGDIEYPPSAKVIRAPKETVMPGLINARSRYQLPLYSRSGVKGAQSVTNEIFLSQMRFDELLEAGFTTVTFVPAGTDIPGVAATYHTAGDDDARLLDDHSFLQVVPAWSGNGKKMLRDAFKKAQDEIEKVKKAREEWEKAQKEKAEKKAEKGDDETPDENGDNGGDEEGEEGDDEGEDGNFAAENTAAAIEEEKPEEFKPPKIDPNHQPLVDMLEKKDGARMNVALTSASDLLHFDDVIEPYEDLPYSLYLATARSTDYQHVVEKLGEREANVLLRPMIHYLPQTTFRYNLADRLARAGAKVATVPWDDSREELLAWRSRIAELVRSGLSREAALKSMTINAAAVIGLQDKLGSLEKGKQADVTFLDGDPLDPHSSVTRVMIGGEVVWKKDKKLAGRH